MITSGNAGPAKLTKKVLLKMTDWIQIGRTKYFLKADRLNWIIARRVKCRMSGSHPTGYKFVHETYHAELSGAFKRVFDETIRLAEAETIQDILRICEETHEMLREVLDRDFSEKRSSSRQKSAA